MRIKTQQTFLLVAILLLFACNESGTKQETVVVYKTDTVYVEKKDFKENNKSSESTSSDDPSTKSNDNKEIMPEDLNKIYDKGITTDVTPKRIVARSPGSEYLNIRQSQYNPDDYKDIKGGLYESKGDPDKQLEQSKNVIQKIIHKSKKKGKVKSE